MLIDWFTVAAQAVNFLILVWLMKRFLYQPILKALDAREQRIAAELAAAQARVADAEAERTAFRQKNEAFAREKVAMMNQASDEVAAERKRMFEQARNDAEVLRGKQQASLQHEYQQLNQEIARRTRAEVLAIARKALADLAGVTLEQRMVAVFVEHLHAMDETQKQILLNLPPETAVLVRTAFELEPAQRSQVETAIREIANREIHVQFEIEQHMLSGIELILQGQKLAWSIVDYMDALEKDVSNLLKAQQQSA